MRTMTAHLRRIFGESNQELDVAEEVEEGQPAEGALPDPQQDC